MVESLSAPVLTIHQLAQQPICHSASQELLSLSTDPLDDTSWHITISPHNSYATVLLDLFWDVPFYHIVPLAMCIENMKEKNSKRHIGFRMGPVSHFYYCPIQKCSHLALEIPLWIGRRFQLQPCEPSAGAFLKNASLDPPFLNPPFSNQLGLGF